MASGGDDFADAAVLQVQTTVGHAIQSVLIVRDQDDRRALLLEREDHVDNDILGLLIERSGGLVH